MNRFALALFGFCVILACPQLARAVDTQETYEPGGLTDFEAYAGYDGIGKSRAERSVFGKYYLGAGITDWFSGYYTETGEFSEHFSEGETSRNFGVIATPLDTYHFDLDLILEFGFVESTDLVITPGFEFNIDGQPDQSSFGLFLSGGAEIGGHDQRQEDGRLTSARYTLGLALAMGGYVTFSEDHQVLVQYDTVVIAKPEAGQRDMEVGALCLGYNVRVHENIELINEVSLDIPQGEEKASGGFFVGMRTTLL